MLRLARFCTSQLYSRPCQHHLERNGRCCLLRIAKLVVYMTSCLLPDLWQVQKLEFFGMIARTGACHRQGRVVSLTRVTKKRPKTRGSPSR